jgi:hypothetical protein
VTARRETRPIGERAGARKKKIVGDVFSRRDGDARKKTLFFSRAPREKTPRS